MCKFGISNAAKEGALSKVVRVRKIQLPSYLKWETLSLLSLIKSGYDNELYMHTDGIVSYHKLISSPRIRARMQIV